MIRGSSLSKALSQLKAVSLSGTAYRMISVPNYSRYGVGTEGAKHTGGHYNLKDQFGVLYLSDRPDTVVHEVHQKLSAGKFNNELNFPYLLLSVNFKLSKLLDLRNARVIAALNLSAEDLDQRWRDLNRKGKLAKTQMLAQACYGSGYEGIIVPSVRLPSTYNLVNMAILLAIAFKALQQT
jgi:RES domain-containing protein